MDAMLAQRLTGPISDGGGRIATAQHLDGTRNAGDHHVRSRGDAESLAVKLHVAACFPMEGHRRTLLLLSKTDQRARREPEDAHPRQPSPMKDRKNLHQT